MAQLSEDEQLRLAFEASVCDTEQPLSFYKMLSYERRQIHHREDKHFTNNILNGHIIQYNCLNQFGSLFDDIKLQYTTASAICGYMTCATIQLLEEYLDNREPNELSIEGISAFVNEYLCDYEQMVGPLRKSMNFIQSSRQSFWMSHGKKEADLNDLKNWVANYEISYYLKVYSSSPTSRESTAFIRYNQWPCRFEATADEFERLQEEKEFGGSMDKKTGTVTYQEADSVFFIEVFDHRSKGSTFYSPEEMAILPSHSVPMLPRILIIDLQGHFVAGLSCAISGEPYLFVFNTTAGNYISSSPAIAWTYDTINKKPIQPTSVVLIGDSTLDNIVWVPDKSHSVTSHLLRFLNCETTSDTKKVINLAADGFTSRDVLCGGSARISCSNRIAAGDPFPPSTTAPAYMFSPLVELKRTYEADLRHSHVVLSIGGNDIREILGDMTSLQDVIISFHQNYKAIISEIQRYCPNIILMLQYKPSYTQERVGYGVYSAIDRMPGSWEGSSVDKMNSLLRMVYDPIYKLAKSLALPILDLPNSFDIYNTDLYHCQIEPSSLGGEIIAHMINFVVQTHDFKKSSRIYSCDTTTSTLSDITSQVNNGKIPPLHEDASSNI